MAMLLRSGMFSLVGTVGERLLAINL